MWSHQPPEGGVSFQRRLFDCFFKINAVSFFISPQYPNFSSEQTGGKKGEGGVPSEGRTQERTLSGLRRRQQRRVVHFNFSFPFTRVFVCS